MYRRFGKRAFDLLAASSLLLVLSPVILLTAIFVRWRLGSPIFFQQPRAGKNGEIFAVLKFRSMTDARDENGLLLPDELRLTGTGKFLRTTSLDELPQLWNVVRGQMSMIGPRPLLTEYLSRYNSHQARRHEVRPGITGWAQVNGRNAIGWEDRFNLDVYYVDNLSLWLDLRILVLTFWKLVRPSGISSDNHVTMERFQGTPESAENAGG